jgi:hypothetical protein
MLHLENPRRLAIRGGVLAVVAVGAWMTWHFWPNPHLARARALREQLAGEAGQALSSEERRELWAKVRAETKHLSPEQRRNLWQEQQRHMMQKYQSLSPQEKIAFLDGQIDRMEQFRRDRPQNADPNGAAARGRFLSPEERDRRRRERLDLTTPEDRALRHEFFKDLQARRQLRGLGGFGFPGRRG